MCKNLDTIHVFILLAVSQEIPIGLVFSYPVYPSFRSITTTHLFLFFSTRNIEYRLASYFISAIVSFSFQQLFPRDFHFPPSLFTEPVSNQPKRSPSPSLLLLHCFYYLLLYRCLALLFFALPCACLLAIVGPFVFLLSFLVNVREPLFARGKIVDPCFFSLVMVTNIAIFYPALFPLV